MGLKRIYSAQEAEMANLRARVEALEAESGHFRERVERLEAKLEAYCKGGD